VDRLLPKPAACAVRAAQPRVMAHTPSGRTRT
jgi:hypothetical protein